MTAIEVELKFQVIDHADILSRLTTLGAKADGIEDHQDTYYRHPCRDFAQTKEALRIRRVKTRQHDDLPPTAESRITYKGPKFPGVVKARQELEWDVESCDHDAQNFEQLLGQLGFIPALTVCKQRRSHQVTYREQTLIVALDVVEELGSYIEIETIAEEPDQVAAAQALVQEFAAVLGLDSPEPRSYLSMRLQKLAQATPTS